MNEPERQRILVVDREDGTRKYVCEYLNKLGYATDSTGSSVEAMTMIGEHQYATVLIDSELDAELDADGENTISVHLLKEYPATPVIILSSEPSVRTVIASLRQGVFDFVIKPYELSDLSHIIPRAIQASKDTIRAQSIASDCRIRSQRTFELVDTTTAVTRQRPDKDTSEMDGGVAGDRPVT